MYTHETVIPPEVLLLQQNEALLAQIQAEKLILAENRDQAIADVAQAQARVEAARAALSDDIAALRVEILSDKDELKAQLAIAADAVISSVEWEQQWALTILEEAKERILQSIDDAVSETDGLAGWVAPRPVNEDAIRAAIERDIQTLNDEE